MRDTRYDGMLLEAPADNNGFKIMRASFAIEREMLRLIDKLAGEQMLSRSGFLEQAARNESTGVHRWYLD